MKIAIYGNKLTPETAADLISFLIVLSEKGIELTVYSPFYQKLKSFLEFNLDVTFFTSSSDFDKSCDLLFSIGGDGTLLDTVAYVQNTCIPVAGINIGRLGFLANVAPDKLHELTQLIFNGNFKSENRTLLECKSSCIATSIYPYALNEVTVQKKGNSIIAIQAWLDDVFLNTYWTDGLIISTPTGSTAYSMSVGGPIAAPSAQVFILSPIASHNLSVRPLVVPDSATLKLKIESRNDLFLTTIDHHVAESSTENQVLIKKAPFQFKLLDIEGFDFFSTIRQKLMWGIDKRN